MNPKSDRSPLYLEDFTAGQIYPSSDPVTVSEADIKRFASEYDPQPFHIDGVAAKTTLFAGLAASGWHTAALTMQMLVTQGAPVAGGLIGGGLDELRWPRPVRPGDRLTVESEILDVRASKSRPQQGIVKMRTTTFNQNHEPVQIMVSNMIVPRRP